MLESGLEQRFGNAIQALDEVARELNIGLRGGLSELRDCDLTRFIISTTPGIETVVTGSDGLDALHYVVSEEFGTYLAGAAQAMPEALEVLKEICAVNIAAQKPLPTSLLPSASLLIRGTHSFPKRPGAKIGSEFAYRFVLWDGALYARDAFGLSLTRNEASPSMSACDAVSLVARQYDLPASYEYIRDLCTHRRYDSFRRQAKYILDHHKDKMLINIGILKRKSAFGPFQGLIRMLPS